MQKSFPEHLTLILLFGSSLLILSQFYNSTNLSLIAFITDNLPTFKTIQSFVMVLIPANKLKLFLLPPSCHLLPSLLFDPYYNLLSLLPLLSHFHLPHTLALSLGMKYDTHIDLQSLLTSFGKFLIILSQLVFQSPISLLLEYLVLGVPQSLIPYLTSFTPALMLL